MRPSKLSHPIYRNWMDLANKFCEEHQIDLKILQAKNRSLLYFDWKKRFTLYMVDHGASNTIIGMILDIDPSSVSNIRKIIRKEKEKREKETLTTAEQLTNCQTLEHTVKEGG